MATLWTLQTKEAWEEALRKGYLMGDKERASFPDAYLWMMGQMRHRLP